MSVLSSGSTSALSILSIYVYLRDDLALSVLDDDFIDMKTRIKSVTL